MGEKLDSAGRDGAGRRLSFSEIDLLQVARDIWGAKIFIALLAVIGVLFSVLILSSAKPTYTATMTVSQSEGAPRPGLSLGQYASAAAAVGIDIGGSADDANFTKFKVLLDSDLLSVALFRRDDLKPFLFGPGWNPETRTFSRPTGFTFELKEFIKGILGLRTWATPGPTEVRSALKRSLTFTADRQTGLVKIFVQDFSPESATFFLRTVVLEADALIRDAAKVRASNRIRYLNEALARTTQQDLRDAILSLLSGQQRSMMMASVDTTFAVEVIDPPYASTVPTSPVTRVVLVTYVLTMIVIGVFAAIFYGLSRLWTRNTLPYTLDGYIWRKLRFR